MVKNLSTTLLSLALSFLTLGSSLSPIYAQEMEELEVSSTQFNEAEDVCENFEDSETPITNAQVISTNATVTGAISAKNQAKWYKFNLSSPGKVSLEFKHDYIESTADFWHIQLYTEDMSTLLKSVSSTGKETGISTGNVGLPRGTYVVKIYSNYNWSDVPFTLKVNFESSNSWEAEPNDHYSNATPVSLNSSWYGASGISADPDWYTFNLNKAGYIQLNFTHSYFENSNGSWDIELYNSDFLKLSNFEISGKEATYTDNPIGLDKGTYYLKINSNRYNWSSYDYTFKVNFTESTDWEIENNNDPGVATSLTLGFTKYGVIRYRDSSDWYLIDTPSGNYTLYFTPSDPNITSNQWILKIYNEDRTSVIEKSFPKDGNTWSLQVPESEKWYIEIKANPYNHSTLTYALSVKKSGNSSSNLSSSDNDLPNNDSNLPNLGNSISMYRLYNPNSGEHHYTSDGNEKDTLVKLGWKYEGVGWIAPITSNTPVYRLYNKNSGDHHYTTDKKERDALVSLGWTYEAIGWYSDDDKGIPLYRQYNPNAKVGTHNYTTDKKENDGLVKQGWKAEGIGWYGKKS